MAEVLLGLTERLDGLVEASRQVTITGQAAPELLSVPKRLANLGAGLTILVSGGSTVNSADWPAARAWLALARRGSGSRAESIGSTRLR